jgi:hypothetical protein
VSKNGVAASVLSLVTVLAVEAGRGGCGWEWKRRSDTISPFPYSNSPNRRFESIPLCGWVVNPRALRSVDRQTIVRNLITKDVFQILQCEFQNGGVHAHFA